MLNIASVCIHVFVFLQGCVVQVTVKNGKVFEGVLRTTSPKVFVIQYVILNAS